MCPDFDAEYRDPTAHEAALIRWLVSHSFVGHAELERQILSLRVKSLDGNGSLKLVSRDGGRALTEHRIPVEAAYRDSDGVVVHVLLHVLDGRLDELEVFREDSAPVGTLPGLVQDIEVHQWPGA